jgi:hypothetical protein
MGIYASVRGWLEIDLNQRAAAEEIIERHRHDLYSGGWAFPSGTGPRLAGQVSHLGPGGRRPVNPHAW